jgi:hypothetical protein
LVSAEANDIATKANKNTVTPENVVDALKSLVCLRASVYVWMCASLQQRCPRFALQGFESYVAEVQASFQSHRTEQSTRVTAKKKFKVQTQVCFSSRLMISPALLPHSVSFASGNVR